MKLLLYRIYQWLIAAPLFIIATFLTSVFTIVGCWLGNSEFWGYWPAHYWSKFCCFIAGVRIEVKGREHIDKNTSYVFTANHQGAFDIWSIFGYLNHKFVWLMKKELENVFMVGWACRKAGYVFVDDTSVAQIRHTIEEAEAKLKGGRSIVIFPEGSRSWDGKMIPFKRGAFMLAAEFKLPVVPITIDGSFRTMPRYTYNMRPGKIVLTIHEPIYPGERGFNTKVLMAQCHEAIESSLPEADRGLSEGRPETKP